MKKSFPCCATVFLQGVDDLGSIMVNWDTGSSLSVVYGVDRCRIFEKKMR